MVGEEGHAHSQDLLLQVTHVIQSKDDGKRHVLVNPGGFGLCFISLLHVRLPSTPFCRLQAQPWVQKQQILSLRPRFP